MSRKHLINLSLAILCVLSVCRAAEPGAGPFPAASDGMTCAGRLCSREVADRSYTLTARIRLLILWISRPGIGAGRIAWSESDDGTRGLALLIGSDPARAPMKINRWGFIVEHVAGSTADLVGVMTEAEEQSIEQAPVVVRGGNAAGRRCRRDTIRSERCAMEFSNQLGVAGTYLWCFALSIVSALVPWVNGEVILLSLTALARSPWALGLLVLAASAGQMAGKCVLYSAGKGVIPLKSERVRKTILTWKGRFERSPSRLLAFVFVSSAVGIPPFYVITILAGALRVRFGPFFTVGACGRLVRFGALAFVPWMVIHWLR